MLLAVSREERQVKLTVDFKLMDVSEGGGFHLFFVVVGFKVELVLEQLEGLKEGYRNNRTMANKTLIPDFGFL